MTAVLLGGCRTPIGRRDGVLAAHHPADLLGAVLVEAVARAGVDPAELDQVLAGCVTQAGEQGYNIARTASLAAGLPAELPGSTIDAQCGSSQQALNLAAALVEAGAARAVLVGGVESMSRVPLGSASKQGPGDPLSESYRERWEVVHQGESAERIADQWSITREECDGFALLSQQRAARARDEGRFDRELMVLPGVDGSAVTADEGIRASTAEGLAGLRAAFREGGRLTAGSSSQISDGAAAVVVADEEWARARGLLPRARVAAQALVAVDPVIKLTGPIPATQRILERSGRARSDLDLVEVNEAFASVVLAWSREFPGMEDRLNVNGGAIALGHPVGATGVRLAVTVLSELERTDRTTGLVTMCCGGGLGTATLLERC
ncbi:thiolase family protein [Nocardioides halotolerans]|uniref:thiolase family protein n=1 Tax=Nocardioides halotolerans TaxID=433660 RepID=UPI0003FAF9A2|nr:thiolase family protein [Nocardioides halotolerans]